MFKASAIELIETKILEILAAARIIAPIRELNCLFFKNDLSYEIAAEIARDDLRIFELFSLEIFILSKHDIKFSSRLSNYLA